MAPRGWSNITNEDDEDDGDSEEKDDGGDDDENYNNDYDDDDEYDDDNVDSRQLAIGTSCQDNHKRSNDSCQFAERGNRKFEHGVIVGK